MNAQHLLWIGIAAAVAFLASFVFGDALHLPLDLYYLIYFAAIMGLFLVYVRKTGLDVPSTFSRRLAWGIVLGLIVAALMVKNVLSRPETAHLTGPLLGWALIWRGLIYGTVDGLLLSVFPWIVTWRAFDAENRSLAGKIGVSVLAWLFIVLTTTAYHLGYSDFRSKKLVQANIGNTIMSLATLLPANPAGTPIAHAALHISAVLHSPETELFLPPHRSGNDGLERPKDE
jgi:hypothetical protein